jgi:hypothetical protein
MGERDKACWKSDDGALEIGLPVPCGTAASAVNGRTDGCMSCFAGAEMLACVSVLAASSDAMAQNV